MYKNVQVSIQEEIHFDVVVRVTRVVLPFPSKHTYAMRQSYSSVYFIRDIRTLF